MPEVTRVRESRYTNRDVDDYSSDDERSSSYGRSRPAGYRTVQRYRVTPSRTDLDDDTRSLRSERYSTPPRAERVEVDRRVERYVEREPERSSRDMIIEREREREPERTRTVVYERERERPREPLSSRPWERERDRPWERETDVRIERRMERREEQPMQLERFQKETEYYERPEPAPQPIIIRQRAPEPQQIIVQEAPPPQPIVLAREEPSYEVIQRSEVQEVIPRPEPRRDDEEYYYRREVRDTDDRGRDDDYAIARYDRRPHDSVSDYSDDEQVIVRRERKSFRSRSPRHRRHLAEGALAGAGAAALLANHREKQGMEVEHRGRNVVGGAVLGAIGTEIATRARSRYREERSRGRRSRSASRDSHSKLKIGLGLAALGVAAAVANKVNQNRIANRDELGRGRSRTRSVSRHRSASTYSRTRSVDKHHDPKHRAATIAKAGAATAAIAGVVEYARNKSRERKGKGSRSRSRLRTGVPIAATGLAGAAVAGLYEMRKAKQEDEELLEETRRNMRRSSRSHSRARSTGYAETIDPELGMVQYGADPVYTKQTTTTESYDPVMSGGGHRSRSRSRRHGYSSDSDRAVGRSRSRSRARDLASGAIATGAAAIGINKLKKHQDRKREREDRRHYREDSPNDYYDDDHYSESYSDSPPRASGGAYYPQNTGGYTTHQTTSTTHVNDIPQYDPRDYISPEAYPAPADTYGRTTAQRGRDGDNVSLVTTESPEEDNLTQFNSTTSLDQPNNRSVTFAPLSPTSSRRLAKTKSNGLIPSSESEPRRHRRRNSDPSSNRPSHRHRRRHSSPSSSEEDIEVLPGRFDDRGRPIERKEEMVERIFHDFEAVVNGRVSWRDILRPLFERR